MTRINLTDEDIAANRQGTLSQKQRQIVRQQRLVWLAGTAGLIAIVVGLAAVLFLAFQSATFADRGELYIILPLGLFWLWLLRQMPRRWQQANLDLSSGQVTAVEGPVQSHFGFGIGLFRSVRYYIQVNARSMNAHSRNGLSFRVSQAQQQLFKTGHPYRIYHTAHGHQFLGALLLVEDSNSAAPPQPVKPLTEPLTTREQEILELIAAGLTNRQIADQLSLSVNTVKMYTSQLYQKMDVSRRTEAAARGRELNLL
jgi:DNA-binding CsgD family transcriptional regulator